MRKLKFLTLIILAALITSPLFLRPQLAKASDPSYPDQGCVNGVLGSGTQTDLVNSPGVVFTPRYSMLNMVAVSIRQYQNANNLARVQAQIWNWHVTPHTMIASTTNDITNSSDAWVNFAISTQQTEVNLPYALILVSRQGHAYWSGTANASCYTRGYTILNGSQQSGLMYGFSTYGFNDGSSSSGTSGSSSSGSSSSGSTGTGAPVADPSGNNPTGVGTSSGSGSSSSGNSSSGSNNSGSNLSKSSWSPDIAGILADYKNNENPGGISGFLGNVFDSPILFLLWPILSFLFWLGVIILIIILIVRHNKKKKLAAAAPVVTSKPSESVAKPEPKKTD